MTNRTWHIVTAIVLVIFLVLLTDPFMYWMPERLESLVLLGAAVIIGLWSALVMNEKANDEREVLHKMQAGRIAYISGIVVLTIALVYQGFSHNLDPWIPATLGVMVVSKLLARIYSERYY